MSDLDNTNGANNTPSPGQQNTVPKERLDELIAQRRLLEEQLQVTQQMLRQAVPAQPRAPQPEPEYLVRLKEENPAAYQALKETELRSKQQSAAFFTMADNVDRMEFRQEFGAEADEYLPKVEAELARLRSQGISSFNRGQLYIHMKGQEAIQKGRSAKTTQAPAAATPAPQNQQNLPSSDPSSAATTANGSASAAPVARTIEDLERELEGKSF